MEARQNSHTTQYYQCCQKLNGANFADSETLLFQTEIFQHKLQIETQVKSNFRINQKAESVGNKCASACVTDVTPICHATGKGKMAAQIFSS